MSLFLHQFSLAQNTGAGNSNWTNKDRLAFVAACITESAGKFSRDSAAHLCYCIQERVEAKYPTVTAATALGDSTFFSAEWQQKIRECFGGWSSTDRNDFVTNCIATAKDHIGEVKARNYCECMLYKVEKKYPVAAVAANALTPDELAKPEWKQAVNDCLGN